MAVVIRDRRVLIQHRYRRSTGMVYEFPGGSIGAGESPELAAKRELMEETSLVVQAEPLACYSYDNELGGRIHFVVFDVSYDAEPLATDSTRQQTFHWCRLAEICLEDSYKADTVFIDSHLVRYIE